jgi:hypothetical protein
MHPGRVAAAALVAFLAVAPYAYAATTPSPVIIDDDHGGSVDTFVMWFQRLKASGTPVVIRGMCESACTFVLLLPREQVCVEPTASLGFHLATINGHDEPEVTGALIRRWYPEVVQQWLSTKRLRAAPLYMDAATIVTLDIFPACSIEAAQVPESQE